MNNGMEEEKKTNRKIYNRNLENSSNVVPIHLECIDSSFDWKIFAQAAWIAALKLKELLLIWTKETKRKKRPWKREINGKELKQI